MAARPSKHMRSAIGIAPGLTVFAGRSGRDPNSPTPAGAKLRLGQAGPTTTD